MNRPALRWLLAVAVSVTLNLMSGASSSAFAQADAHAEVLDLDETAAFLRVKPELVRALAEMQRVPARRVGDVWRFSRAALLEWLKGEQFAGKGGAPPGGLDRAEELASELETLTARGVVPESATRVTQATPAATPVPSRPPPTVGERPVTPTAEEIALRDQRVLLRQGGATVDIGLSYSRSEQTLFPVVRTEHNTVGAVGTLRYGLLDDFQVTLRVPAAWRRTATFSDAAIAGTNAPRVSHDEYVGDASVSVLGVALREAVGRPNIIWSIDGVVPTGPGDTGVGGGLVLSKSYDPAVLFAGLSYLYGLSFDASNSRRSLAQHNFGLNLGYTYAVNETLALNTALLGVYRNAQSPDGVAIAPAHERYFLQLGMTWLLGRGLFMEPAVAMGLGGESPDLTISLNVPYSF